MKKAALAFLLAAIGVLSTFSIALADYIGPHGSLP
jgi:hypothetical protein